MKKLLFALLVLPLLAVACGPEDDPTPTPNAPKLTLTSASEVEFDAKGGNGTITYSYNAGTIIGDDQVTSDIEIIKVNCEAEWITIPKKVAPLGEIRYTVAKNEISEQREAKIIVSFDALSFEVKIKQAAATNTPEPEPSFEGWGIIGTMNEWDATKAIIMESANGYYVAKAIELTTTDKFKFIKNGDNAVNRGGNGQAATPDYFYTAQSWGSDIHASVAGTFDIYLNAKEDTYYIMTEGKSPAEALEPLAPGEDLYEVYGNFEGEKSRLTADGKYLAAKGIKFNDTTAEFDIRMNETEKTFGAKEDATYALEEQIEVAECNTPIKVEVEADVEYDIYYRTDLSSIWLMPAGSKPLIWEEVTGVAFSDTNFALNLKAEDLELYFDFYCGEKAVNNIIPEATYYVYDENDGGYNFNLENEYDIRIKGVKTKLKSGTMVIKHISGGYDITVDVVSIHNHVVKAHYAGPIGEIAIMGRPITNPE